MQSVNIVREIDVNRTPRVQQVEGLFDVPVQQRNRKEWVIDLPYDDEPWNIGIIVGPSGAGKSTLADEIFKKYVTGKFKWGKKNSVLDDFPEDVGIKDITKILSNVGFASPPSWVKPFHVLSTGEQFRVTIARALVENRDLTVIDEFTSVVDRTVAKIGSHAISKFVRKNDKKFIALSCHYDIIDWLEPDWVYEVHVNKFTRRRLRRPKFDLTIHRVHKSAWDIFKNHHYLTQDIHPSATCFVGTVNDVPAVFNGVKWFPHPKRPGWRSIRVVTLPDYQGVGLGNIMADYIASLYKATGLPYRAITGHPSLIQSRCKSPKWKMVRKPSIVNQRQNFGWYKPQRHRKTATFEYVGPSNVEGAKAFQITGV